MGIICLNCNKRIKVVMRANKKGEPILECPYCKKRHFQFDSIIDDERLNKNLHKFMKNRYSKYGYK